MERAYDATEFVPVMTSRSDELAERGKQRSGRTRKRIQVAQRGAQRRRDGRDPHQEHLPASALRTPTLAHRTRHSDRRRQALDARRRLDMLTHGQLDDDLEPDYYRRRDPAAPPSASSRSSNASDTASPCRRPTPRRAQTYFPISGCIVGQFDAVTQQTPHRGQVGRSTAKIARSRLTRRSPRARSRRARRLHPRAGR